MYKYMCWQGNQLLYNILVHVISHQYTGQTDTLYICACTLHCNENCHLDRNCNETELKDSSTEM